MLAVAISFRIAYPLAVIKCQVNVLLLSCKQHRCEIEAVKPLRVRPWMHYNCCLVKVVSSSFHVKIQY